MEILFVEAQGGPVPGVEVEVNFGGLTSQPTGDKDTTIVAEILAAGTGVDDTLSGEFGSYEEVAAYAGDRSPAAYMAAQWFDFVGPEVGRPKGRLKIASIAELVGTAAVQTLTFVGTASADGTWVLRVGGVVWRVAVQKDDDPTAQATKAQGAWDKMAAKDRLPILVTFVAGVVTLTASVKGAHLNDIATVTLETPDITTTATWSDVTMGGALGTPGVGVHAGGNLTNVITAMSGVRNKFLVPDFNDDASLEELVTHINSESDATIALGCQMVVSIRDTKTNAISAATSLDDGDDCQRVIYLNVDGDSDWIGGISARCQSANAAEPHAARSLDFLTVTGLYVAQESQAYNRTDMRTLIENGVTPLATQDGAMKIARWTMCKTLHGVLDGAVPYVSDFVRDKFAARITPEARESIVDNDQPAFATHVTSPEARRGLYHDILKECEEGAVLTNVSENISAAQILRSDASTLQAALPIDMLAQKHNEMIRLDIGLG